MKEKSTKDSCISCGKALAGYDFKNGHVCIFCFNEKYGSPILGADRGGEYHGGHKAYVAGGVFSKFEFGRMYLTERYFIFQKNQSNKPEKNFDIIIPLKSVLTDSWRLEEESRRQQFSGAGIGGMNSSGLGGGFGSGIMQSQGKAHHIVIPYIDENGIRQEPRFGITSFGGKAIREWSEKIYEQIVKIKQEDSQKSKPDLSMREQEDPLQILKVRYAKGEITKEQFEQMKKDLES